MLKFWHVCTLVLALVPAWISDALGQDICLHGCPRGGSPTNIVIERPIYVISNNELTKFADWAAYVVRASTIGRTESRVWAPDPDLPGTVTLEPDDYQDANLVLQTDRGHQVPLASFTGTPHWPLTNYLSNITPQSAALNQGPWERLEKAERTLARRADIAAVYVLTGPLYEHNMRPLPRADESHVVPSGYWKAVAVETSAGLSMAAFLMHQNTLRNANFCNFIVPVRVVEHRSGFNLFPMLDARQQEELETQPGTLVEKLGCRLTLGGDGARMEAPR